MSFRRMQETEISRPPHELACIIGNLFAGLEPPCEDCNLGENGLTICGPTHSGNYGRLTIQKDRCIFYGRPEDLAEVLNGECPGKVYTTNGR